MSVNKTSIVYVKYDKFNTDKLNEAYGYKMIFNYEIFEIYFEIFDGLAF